MSTQTKILYITGRGGSLDKGLSVYLASITENFEGIAVDIPFLRQDPLEQVEAIYTRLASDPDRIVIANSYGAYLTLQALVDLKAPPKKLLLLAPVLGMAAAKDRMYMSRPPFTKRLKSAFSEERVAKPEWMRILVGDQDPLYNAEQFAEVGRYFGERVLGVIPGEGHGLDKQTIQYVIGEIIAKGH